jgi:serine protease Do
MKRHIHIISLIRHAVLGSFLAALVLSLSVPRVSAAEISPDTPHPAVARIMSLETNAASFGSGTLIYKQGKHALLVTNHHVIRDSKEEILVSFPNGFRSSAKVVASDPTWDLAALLIWSPSIDAVQITKKAPQSGDELTIAGYGSGRYRAVSGICSQYVSPGLSQPHEMVELKAVARQGDSGGPIFNQDGELAGVLFGAGWRTTAGSYSGRVKKFLDPVVGRMQKSAVEKQSVELPSNESPVSASAAESSQPKAKITGLTVDQTAVNQHSPNTSGNTGVDDHEGIAAKNDSMDEDAVAGIAVSPNPSIAPLPKTAGSSTTIEDQVVEKGPDSRSSEPAIEPAEGEAILVDQSYFESQALEPKESEIQVSELPETPGKQIEYDSQFPTAQQDEDAQSAADTSEELQVEGSTRDVSQFSSTDQPERVMDRTTGIDLSPESLESNETVIGWKQLAGETLLQQIRTVLAGIGFLAVVVQLARR